VAGVDLGGTAVNYTIVDQQEKFLIDNLCEHPALSTQGPDDRVSLELVSRMLNLFFR
jgi:hypothetical protein